MKRIKSIKKILMFVMLPLLCVTSLTASSYASSQTFNKNSALCQEVQKRIETVTQNISMIYDDNTDIYMRFSNILTIDKLPDASNAVQNRLRGVYTIVQKNQIELMNLYSLICSGGFQEKGENKSLPDNDTTTDIALLKALKNA